MGQKNKITRRWAKRGSRPSAPRDQRTRSAWLFGAICPREGKAAGLVLPRCNTNAMTLHLAEISRAVKKGAHAVVILDQAGWHGAKDLEVPDNITLLPLPPRSPEWTHPGKVERPYAGCSALVSNLTGLMKPSVECRRTGL